MSARDTRAWRSGYKSGGFRGEHGVGFAVAPGRPYRGRGRAILDLIMSGAMIGLLMASVFITVGELMLFFLYKNRTPAMEGFFERVPPARLAMGIVAGAYPT